MISSELICVPYSCTSRLKISLTDYVFSMSTGEFGCISLLAVCDPDSCCSSSLFGIPQIVWSQIIFVS
ncbi:hypothetical protein RSAG8_00633, partial [Rhizoctonia solani AG-8 WAC10335]